VENGKVDNKKYVSKASENIVFYIFEHKENGSFPNCSEMLTLFQAMTTRGKQCQVTQISL